MLIQKLLPLTKDEIIAAIGKNDKLLIPEKLHHGTYNIIFVPPLQSP